MAVLTSAREFTNANTVKNVCHLRQVNVLGTHSCKISHLSRESFAYKTPIILVDRWFDFATWRKGWRDLVYTVYDSGKYNTILREQFMPFLTHFYCEIRPNSAKKSPMKTQKCLFELVHLPNIPLQKTFIVFFGQIS